MKLTASYYTSSLSEMGCPHSHFDRDDPKRRAPDGARDWKQISVVTNEMSDSWSGFVAYAYDGPEDFVMFSGGPWNGKDALSPTRDFYNFKMRLEEAAAMEAEVGDLEERLGANSTDDVADGDETILPRRCSAVESDLLDCCDLRLFNDDKIRSFQKVEHTVVQPASATIFSNVYVWFSVAVLAVGIGVYIMRTRKDRSRITRKASGGPNQNGWHFYNGSIPSNYGSI